VVAVEHDRDWWGLISAQLRRRGHAHAECRHVPVIASERMASLDWEADWPYFVALGGPPGRPEFYDYMAAIDAFPDESFDLVAIDGRERLGCLVHGAGTVRPGGLLILDDSNRPRYARAFELLREWRPTRFQALGHETTIFVKPTAAEEASNGRSARPASQRGRPS
jgi:hypothetical protein